MAMTIEVRRHTDNDGDVLSADGIEHALALGRNARGTDYALVVSTGAQRATQAAACIIAGGGLSVPGGVVVVTGMRSGDEDRWRAAYQSAGSGHLDALRDADPDFVDAEVAALGAALRDVADRLADGQRALVIGHSPTNEAAVLGLTGTTIDPLSTGHGVVATGGGDHWRVTPAGTSPDVPAASPSRDQAARVEANLRIRGSSDEKPSR